MLGRAYKEVNVRPERRSALRLLVGGFGHLEQGDFHAPPLAFEGDAAQVVPAVLAVGHIIAARGERARKENGG